MNIVLLKSYSARIYQTKGGAEYIQTFRKIGETFPIMATQTGLILGRGFIKAV